MLPIRFTDLLKESSPPADFAIRRRIPTIMQMGIIFLITLVITVSVTTAFIDKLAVIGTLTLLLGAVGSYMAMQLQRSRDLVLATEFQNALFASAVGMNNKFCMIIRQDGNVVYMDRPFQQLFPDFLKDRQRTIINLLKHGKVDNEVQEKILGIIADEVFDKAIFEIRGSNNQPHRVVMSIEPITRPRGFVLLRAREYVERQTSGAMKPSHDYSPLLNKSNISLFTYVMDAMGMGAYITDPFGGLVYANPVLEQWLAFREGEISSGSFALKDIIHHNGQRPGTIDPNDFEGNVTLQKKAGGLMKAFIHQKRIISDDNKTIGCVALVQYLAESGAKKEKW